MAGKNNNTVLKNRKLTVVPEENTIKSPKSKPHGAQKGNKNAHKEIDAQLVRDLAGLFLSQEEIAILCRCSVDTLVARFRDDLIQGKMAAKASILQMQQHYAKQGNTALLIWLGKVQGGQKEAQQERSYEPEVRELLKKFE